MHFAYLQASVFALNACFMWCIFALNMHTTTIITVHNGEDNALFKYDLQCEELTRISYFP